MATKKRGLGKGLDALLGAPGGAASMGAVEGGDELRVLAVDLIQRGQYQPRSEFNEEAMTELAASIKAQGVVQPILVRPLTDKNRYEIIAGERRWRAAQLAGLHEVPVVLRQMDDQTAMCLALIENMQREDLNPLEQAQGLARLLKEFDMTHDSIAEAVGRSRSSVSNLLRLLELNPSVKKMLEKGELEMGHARALLALPSEQQLEAARTVHSQSLSVRATEAFIRRLQTGDKKTSAPKAKKDPNVTALETELSERLGAGVRIRQSGKGKGSLEILYNSLDELDGILKRIK